MKTVTSAQMRRIDQQMVERYGIPVFLLMDNAGRCVAEATRALLGKRSNKVLVLAGSGNNGGDGIVAARYLKGWGYKTEVLWLKNPTEWKGSAALHYAIARRMGVGFRSFLHISPAQRLPTLRRADVLIDALLGTGTHGALSVPFFDAIATVNAARKPVVAVDLPSGLDANKGRAPEIAIKATVTVTFAAAKKGLLKPSAKPYVGKMILGDIGIPRTLIPHS
jgi:NAD(P)H-hydrate epimerase